MAVQQLIWIALIGAVIVNGFPVKSPQAGNEDERLNYEKYVRQLEKKHKFAYNDIDQPWQPISGDDSVEYDSHEIILQQDDFVSAKPVVRDTKHQTTESPVVAADEAILPVTEAHSQAVTLTDVVAAEVEITTTQEKILADPVDNVVPATTTQEKLLADAVDDGLSVTTTHEKLLADAEDDAISVTTTHEKLLADEVLGQSDTATEQDVATISPVNEPVEESTTLSVLKVALIEESLVKVAQVEESEISEGSGQDLIDSTNDDEGSGAADVFKIDAAEGSGSTVELFKEIQTTIQPEISDDEVATETESTLLLNNDGLAGGETDLAITTEAADTKLAATVEQQLDEKEVKPTDSPSADEAEQTETQPSSTIKIAHAGDSIEAVTTDSSIAISDVRLDSTTKDSAEPEESTTLVNIVLKDEILANEATQEITTEQPDSHPVWELSDVNISDIVDVLGLDGYVALSDVIVLPVWFKVTMTALFVGCLIWASISNVRMLVAIGIRRSSWSKTNVLIGALALSDLLTVSSTTPTEISSVIHDLNIWDFGRLGCVSFPFLQSAAILSNALILCLIAYDRYVCVVKMQPHTMKAKPGWPIVGCIVAVWIISIGIALPSFWIWRVYYFILVDDIPDPEIGMDFCSVFPSCNSNTNLGPKIYPAYHVMLCGAIFVPLFLLFVVLYGRIGHFLWVRSPIGTGDSSNLHLARKKRIAWALFWLVFWFFFCRMPNWIFVMVTMFVDEENTSGLSMLKSTLVFLSVLNTVVNPWLYSQLNEPLKKTMIDCSEKLCGQIRNLSCCGTEKKVGLYDEQQQHHLAQQLERRGSHQGEPIVIMEEPGIIRPPANELAIFTVHHAVHKLAHAEVTQSTSKNGNKTRQTFLE